MHPFLRYFAGLAALLTALGIRESLAAEPEGPPAAPGDRMLAAYFAEETQALADACLSDIRTLDDWQARRGEYLRQLREMLGLDPLPERTPLAATVTGRVEEAGFIVERIHFQSRPGLYVTGNLYRPREQTGPLPGVLYVCGHGQVKKDGISYGNKTHYQHHGGWFARNGYVCLIIDSLQLGEIEGIHHGTHRYGRWWWLDRGYTPAGVEAWNCIRALDYLQSRPEVDPERLGVTGRSGGGAYSWWIAALDERIKAAVPVAGITDLTNHVVDGCVEGHCDCMYFVNTYRWDYPLLAALVAPRPLLISNTDSDGIFPLDGVVRTFEKVRRIYTLYGAREKVALNITAGPHKDTQELQVHAFRWLNHHLQQDDGLIETTAIRFFEPPQLRVFDQLPADERNTRIDESFVAAAPPPPRFSSAADWAAQRETWRELLRTKSFRAWPEPAPSLQLTAGTTAELEGVRLRTWDFRSQGAIQLRLFVLDRGLAAPPRSLTLTVLGAADWPAFTESLSPAFAAAVSAGDAAGGTRDLWDALRHQLQGSDVAQAFVAPRGVGLSAWDAGEKKQVQHRRRFYLLGQTWEGMQAWDIRQAIRALRAAPQLGNLPLQLQARGPMAGVAVYAALFEPGIARVELVQPVRSHRDGAHLLNVQRYLDLPQSVAMLAEQSPVTLVDEAAPWEYPQQVAQQLGWNHAVTIRAPGTDQSAFWLSSGSREP